jgi:hypothetical protein
VIIAKLEDATFGWPKALFKSEAFIAVTMF